MTIGLKRLGKKPFFAVTGGDGEPLGLVDFEGKGKLRLSDGCEADEAELTAEIAESEKRIARSHAFFLLSRRDYATGELVKKLRELPVSEEAALSAAERLTELGYLRDGEYAARVAAHYASGGYGPLKVSAELRRRGFDSATAEEATALLEESFDFPEAARAEAEKKFGSLNGLNYEQKGKITAFLARRGYTYDQIGRALG